ncbi:MAG: flippase-like domain-containing protein, partial [Candidatus Hydrogenedentes bacterium]|nr:flippase-like domain-containing protein [Candidatus Hydrogenedentota bacterium]
RNANWWWVALSLALVFVTFLTRVKRWGYIVRTAQPVSFRAMFSATQIGFLGNFTLPARVGEVIRAVVLARLTGLTFSRCFAFVALDRVTDLFGLVVVMLLAATVFQPTEAIVLDDWTIEPDLIRVTTLSTIVLVTGIISAFVALYCRKALALRLVSATVGRVSPWLSEKLQGMLAQFADGMHVFKSVGDMSRAIFWSLVTWTIGTLCYFCVVQAFALDVPWYTAIIVMAFLAVAISVPGPPGFVGTFHFGIVGALLVVAPETDRDVAKAAALVAHMVNTLPVWVAGAVCLYTEKLGLLELRREGEHVDDEAETDAVSTPLES